MGAVNRWLVASLVLLGAFGCTAPAPEPLVGVDPERVAPSGLPTAPELADATGARGDVTIDDCATGVGQQTVTGEVTNSGEAAADYVLSVSWINATYDVYARGVVVVEDLDAGESRAWQVVVDVARDADQCTLNVQRGEVAA